MKSHHSGRHSAHAQDKRTRSGRRTTCDDESPRMDTNSGSPFKADGRSAASSEGRSLSRRTFLAGQAMGLTGVLLSTGSGASPARAASAAMASGNITLPVRGRYYQAEVPDTLDLAERAKLGLQHFTNATYEDHGYEMPLTVDFAPPAIQFHMNSVAACQCKAMEAMAMLRVASGSKEGLEREAKMVKMMASFLGDDGLYWIPGGRADKPWIAIREPFVMVHGQGRMMRAMIAWHQYTGDPAWKERIDRLVDGLDRKLVVRKNDYAYIPVRGHYDEEYLRSCYTRRGWKDTSEPTDEKFGEEGSLFNHQGHLPGALANWYRLTGNTEALRLAGELVRFYIKPKFWADWKSGEYPGVVGAEHAHWNGHFHGYINTLRAILEYAMATNDVRLMAFVRDGYEWARQAGLARINLVGDLQGCAVGRIIGLAVKLTYAGVGDYWEDVDQYIRNGGSEMQITSDDLPQIRRLQKDKPASSPNPALDEAALAAAVGSFAGRKKDCWWLCCSPHGNMGIFYAWDGIVRYSDGVAQVNLLLNRVSPWMDIDSYIPFEGKVMLRNKAAREAFVRMPLYVDKKTVNVHLQGRAVGKEWLGRYLWLRHLRAGDVATVEFPMEEKTEQWSTPPKDRNTLFLLSSNTTFTFRLKGNTLVEVTPPLMPEVPGGWLFESRKTIYGRKAAGSKRVTRFVTPTVLQW